MVMVICSVDEAVEKKPACSYFASCRDYRS